MAKNKNKNGQSGAGRFFALVGLGMAAFNLFQALKDYRKK